MLFARTILSAVLTVAVATPALAQSYRGIESVGAPAAGWTPTECHTDTQSPTGTVCHWVAGPSGSSATEPQVVVVMQQPAPQSGQYYGRSGQQYRQGQLPAGYSRQCTGTDAYNWRPVNCRVVYSGDALWDDAPGSYDGYPGRDFNGPQPGDGKYTGTALILAAVLGALIGRNNPSRH